MLNIVFTADYELFFGKNIESEYKILIEPTDKLIKVLNKNNIPLTLFADICSIFRYKQLNLNEYVNMIEKQMIYAVKGGNDIQLHIHPHWIYSNLENGEWIFNHKFYRLHNLNEKELNKVVEDSVSYLNNLIKPYQNNYKCIAFRAGGWCIQPEEAIIEVLLKNQIHIDSTIFKGGFYNYNVHYYDFRNTPNKINWYIDKNNGINKDSNDFINSIYEIPIASTKLNIFYKFYDKIYTKLNMGKREIRGLAINNTDPNINNRNIITRIIKHINCVDILQLEGTSSYKLEKIIQYYLKNFDCVTNDYYISLICHPKALYEYEFRECEKFIQRMKKYKQVKFTTFNDANIKYGGKYD